MLNDSYQVLEYENENSFTNYPFQTSIFLSNLFVEAKFFQYDNFIPVFNFVRVLEDEAIFTFTFDFGIKQITLANDFDTTNFVEITDVSRHVGKFKLGAGFYELFTSYVGQTEDVEVSFAINTIKTIPSKAGLFSLSGINGAIEVLTDDNLFFELDGQQVTWNAVARDAANNLNYLKTINNVAPVNNNIFFADNELLKVNPDGNSLIFSFLQGLQNINTTF